MDKLRAISTPYLNAVCAANAGYAPFRNCCGLEHLRAEARGRNRRFGAEIVADRRVSRAQATLRSARRRERLSAFASDTKWRFGAEVDAANALS